jgi:acetyltransferase-like isoleucine patch superfamily enzyme
MKLSRFLMPPIVLTPWALVRHGVKISPRAEVEWSRNMEAGRGVTISSYCKVKSSSGPLRIGAGTQIASFCFLSSHTGGLEIGSDCMIGPNASITANGYRYDDLDKPVRLQEQTSIGIRIGDDVWIAAGVVVLDGADIGSGSIVTPNSVVSGRIPENSVVQGSPAKVIFTRR